MVKEELLFSNTHKVITLGSYISATVDILANRNSVLEIRKTFSDSQ